MPSKTLLPIQPLNRAADAVIQVPGSKSYTNRALLIAALASGKSTLRQALFSDDTARMCDCLRALGFRVEDRPAENLFDVWGGSGRIPAETATLHTGNSGTTARSMLAVLALGHGTYILDGDERMRQRPIGHLIDALNTLGASVRSVKGTGCPPVEVRAQGLRGGKVAMPGSHSSQYFTALLLVAPVTRDGMEIEVVGEMVSRPYIDLTAQIMSDFGAVMDRDAGFTRLTCAGGQGYQPRDYFVEPDASNASYFVAAAALTAGRVKVPHLGVGSAQGDLGFLKVLETMGCTVLRETGSITVIGPDRLHGVTVNANAFSDTSLTLCAMAPFADGPTEIRDIEHSRLQECDRISAAVTELRRLGQDVEEFPDGLRITPRPVKPAVIETYNDHRVAMGFSLVGLKSPGVVIADPACTAKTFPTYFDRLAEL